MASSVGLVATVTSHPLIGVFFSGIDHFMRAALYAVRHEYMLDT